MSDSVSFEVVFVRCPKLGEREMICEIGRMESILLHGRAFRPYLSEGAIRVRVIDLAHQISLAYQGVQFLAIPVLQGSFLFAADLLREVKQLHEMYFIRVASYGSEMKSSGQVQWMLDLPASLDGQHVLLVEDIVDTGRTIDLIRAACIERGAASVKVATLLFKPNAFQGALQPEYVGFSIPDDFVVGYGLDYDQLGRNLKSIYQLEE